MGIVIAEDAAVIRAGLAEILADSGHEVGAAVGDAEALKAAVAERRRRRLPAKDRVANVSEFIDAIAGVAAGGTALDPEVVAGMPSATRHAGTLPALTAREHDVLALMAEDAPAAPSPISSWSPTLRRANESGRRWPGCRAGRGRAGCAR